jgi:hypothetical protein
VRTDVVLEVGSRRAFASAVDWPGWCRSGRDPDAALEALAAAAPRYAMVAGFCGITFPAGAAGDLDVIERLPGTATTDFGAPGEIASADLRVLTNREAARLATLVTGAWLAFDVVAASAPPELRKGPRGGGRDRDGIVEHVLSAEASYARKLGVRRAVPAAGDREAIEDLRGGISHMLRAARKGEPATPKAWPARYAARRIAWHVVDHAWEIEDRSE